MLNQNPNKKALEKTRDKYANRAVIVAIIAMIGIAASPTISIVIGVTVAGAGVGLFTLGKINKINEEIKENDDVEK